MVSSIEGGPFHAIRANQVGIYLIGWLCLTKCNYLEAPRGKCHGKSSGEMDIFVRERIFPFAPSSIIAAFSKFGCHLFSRQDRIFNMVPKEKSLATANNN